MRWSDQNSLRGVLGAFGKRANTKGMSQGSGIHLLLEKKQINGELHYRMSSELRSVIDSLPALREAMKLSVDEIHARYEYEHGWLSLPPFLLTPATHRSIILSEDQFPIVPQVQHP
jgi:hypothetical protein